ncbi:response regulator transcription factor [Cohnella sp.]|uniref:response regulator transcription factor n=1 Tax=Cohnella sp. TaxID=1883426 RepID=UPI003565AE13
MRKIRVLLVALAGEDRQWRRKLTEELERESDIEVIGTAPTVEEAIKEVNDEAMDIVLVDAGVSAGEEQRARAVREMGIGRRGRLKTIMLVSNTDREAILNAFLNGAVNALDRSKTGDIAKAIRDAHAGRSAIHPDAAEIVREELKLMTLTPMEREVYRLKCKGFSKRQIADRLFKSENTIKTQMRSIREKLPTWG